MRKISITAAVLIVLVLSAVQPVFSNDNPGVVEAFRKNFTRGSLSTKVRVLQDSLEYKDADMSPLYTLSLDFIISNTWMLQSDTIGRDLMFFTIRLLGTNGITEAADNLWLFFKSVDDSALMIEIMNALGDTAAGKQNIIYGINAWLRDYNTAFKAGKTPDSKLVAEAVATLGKLGDPTSFPIVFTTGTIGYSETVNLSANEALGKIDGYFTDHIIEVIRSSVPEEKLAALKAAYGQSNLTRDDKASIALVGLDIGLYSEAYDSAEEGILRELRYEAVRQLTALNWAGATDNLVKHFDSTVFELEQGLCRKVSLIEAIDALGNAGTHDAAIRLTLYLEVLNSYTENGQIVDEQVILSVIRNLGELGDNTAFDYLLYTGYLNYSGTVQRAAREALKNLKNI
ncbi:MAG: hypothetical protein PQJ61_02235 [Spirochaetales bacterium]|uniref:HEAT repeat domain-containing protein n=1 Tax=Candidatus Thalassospirochaeta sargassi TaxID=3119039 RepID=A0AAJ1ID24_9SPIO|nr:hypothetical protein [Spirochaetales bacterium]